MLAEAINKHCRLESHSADLVYHGPGVLLRDGGGEGVKDLVQTEAVLGVELAASPARPPPEQLQLAALHDELERAVRQSPRCCSD